MAHMLNTEIPIIFHLGYNRIIGTIKSTFWIGFCARVTLLVPKLCTVEAAIMLIICVKFVVKCIAYMCSHKMLAKCEFIFKYDLR